MKKSLMISTIALAGVLTLTGCQNKQQAGMLIGAGAGALLGGSMGGGGGKVFTTVGGAILGGLIGGSIGSIMDKQDEITARQAATQVPVGQEATWHNDRTGATYTVRPVKQYRSRSTHEYCREYQTKVVVGGKTQDAYGKACRKPDGSWQIVNN